MDKKIDNRAFHDLSYGLYIITTKNGTIVNGQLVNTVAQATSNPPYIVVIINNTNYTHELITKSGVFAALVLKEESVDMKFLGPFGFRSGRDYDKFANISFKTGFTGSPIIIEKTLSALEAEVMDTKRLKTHTIFISKVVSTEVLDSGTPLTYSYYHNFLKGKTSPKSPTFTA